MRIGIFGGSFDPVHFGHLLLAESCREQCGLDQVWFVPAWNPPHKLEHALTSANHRMEMLRLAVAGHDDFIVSDCEIQRAGISYSVETLEAIRQQQPEASLMLLMGADSLHDLPTWRNTARICEIAIPVVVRRRSSPEPSFDVLRELVPAERLDQIRRFQVQMPLVEFSSTDIRAAIAAGRSIRYQTPRAVEAYIQTHGLYDGKDLMP